MGIKSTLYGRFDSEDRVFLKRSALAAAIRVLGLILVFLLHMLLARLIGDSAEYGKYAWGQSLLFMSGLLIAMGLPVVTGRFIASLIAQGNQSAIRAVILRARVLILVPSFFMIVASVLLFLMRRESDNIYLVLASVALLFAPAVAYANLYRDISRARQWLGLALLPMQVIRPVFTAGLCFAAWFLLGGRIDGGLALGMVAASVILVGAGQALIYHRRQAGLPHQRDNAASGGEYVPNKLLYTAMPVFVVRCAGLTMKYSNVLLLGLLAGPVASGIYFAAERLAGLAGIPGTVVSTVNQQTMAAAYATNDKAALGRAVTRSAHGSFWPSVTAALILVIFAEPLLLLFGSEFGEARPILLVLALTHVLTVFMGPVQDVLIMSGKQKLIPKVMLCCAILHVSVLLILVPTIGAVGAALASTVSGVVSSVWMFILVRTQLGIGATILGSRRIP